MLAFHSDPAIKLKYLARVEDHRKLDQLRQGATGEDGKGCAVWCTLDAYSHSRYPVELGIPIRLAHLEDRLFELLDAETSQRWPERFLSAIRPGADLGPVWGKWAAWMLVDPEWGVIQRAKREATKAAIQRVADLWRDGGTPEQFREARYADAAADAYAAAAADAYAAADAAADAYAAADAAAYAYGVGAWAAARQKWARAACDKLITLLEAA